jgi:hypothetical protein
MNVEGASVSGSTFNALLKANGGVLKVLLNPTAGTDNPRCVRVRRAPLRGSNTPAEGSSTEGVMGSCICG